MESITRVETVEDCFESKSMYLPDSYQKAYDLLEDGERPNFKEVDPTKGIVTSWKRGKTRKIARFEPIVYCKDAAMNCAGGTGGSTAKFTIVNNYLYIVNWDNMSIFNIQNPLNIPKQNNTITMENGIQTIFPHKRETENYLLIGAINGVHFYKIEDALNPQHISKFTHIVASDPVITATDPESNKIYAFSTIRSWNSNNFFTLDITDAANHKLIEEKALTAPTGLSCDWPYLFVCDDNLKMLSIDKCDDRISVDTTNPLAKITWNKRTTSSNSRDVGIRIDVMPWFTDVIAWDGTLIVTGFKGIQLYDYSSFMDKTVENPEIVEKSRIDATFTSNFYY